MFDTVQIFSVGAAAVIDTVLLVALLEQRNRQFARVPVLILFLGAWLLHVGLFALLLSAGFSGALALPVQYACLMTMAVGLVLMPCALMHAAIRVRRHGLTVLPHGNPAHAVCYLPVLALVPVAFNLEFSATESGLEPLLRFAIPFVVWTAVVNVFAAVTFWRVHPRIEDVQARRFLAQLAGILVGMTILKAFVFFFARFAWPAAGPYLVLACLLSPIVPAVVFAYFVTRYNFLQLVLERSLVYGGFLAGMILFHQVAFQDVSRILPERYRLPLVILEGVALTALILLYQPLRQRSAEALRYLLGTRVSGVRERLRRLATELTAQAGRPPLELLGWFAQTLRAALEVDYVAGWLLHPSGDIRVRCGDAERLTDGQVGELHRQMQEAKLVVVTPRSAPGPSLRELLRRDAAALAVLKGHQQISGLLVIGRRAGNAELGEEETNAVLLLVEQLAISADNSLLQAERLAAERRVLQNEKLSALGLLASSIAHEVKNPLSAIKTIATVLAEDLGPHSAHAEDVRLILGEVDRLANSTAHLLEFAKPRTNGGTQACVGKVLAGTLQLLRHVARQQDIAIETAVEDDLPLVLADESALREVFFNLLSNSLDAAGPGGRVSVACQRRNGGVVAEVRDSGPGLPDEVRARLFEPFMSTKPAGTGLGLYVVGRRVQELGGEIDCASGPDGTCFLVKLRVS